MDKYDPSVSPNPENLFGNKAWLEVKQSTSVKTWRKYAVRILSAIEHSAKATVKVSDPRWHEQLHVLVSSGQDRIRSAESTETVFAALASSLGYISFHQLGGIPSHGRRKRVSLRHEAPWKCDKYRSVQYVQTAVQAEAEEFHLKSLAKNRIEGGE